MYRLSYYKEQNERIVFEFMQKNSFAIVTGIVNWFPVATHIPLEIKKENNDFFFDGPYHERIKSL